MMHEKIREDFPMLKIKVYGHDLVYFDNAVTTLKPKPVIETLLKFYQEEYASVNRSIYETSLKATSLYQAAREKVCQLLKADGAEIVFTSGTTASINLVAASFSEAFLKPGDEILLSTMEHHSNIVPWQRAAERTGAQIRVIPVLDTGALDLEALSLLLTPKVKMVAITHISNAFGIENPIEEIVRVVRQKTTAKILLDGAQSAPHLPIDVSTLDVDFFLFVQLINFMVPPV